MYEKIMVPLDGSELAECVLPHVEVFIKGCHVSNVVFVRVVEPVTEPSGISIGTQKWRERESTRKSAAKDYLDQIKHRLSYEGTELYSEVLVGRVADSLADYTEKNNIDLILIATHGRSGVTRWARGSIADKILRFSDIPVLMVRAPGTKGGI
ncbi:MAG: universal stress protein [Anaerolineales bacterium]|jgi:nucleotide-binding universal stress UspA family protein